jgi:hypothetical protein
MDDADRAEEKIEQAMDDALAEVRRSQERGVKAVGLCLYCGETLPAPLRFCDAGCRDGYDHEQRIRRMAGVA